MNSITSRLSKRLLALYGFVDFSCASILDVGADHALFSLGLIQKGYGGVVYASEKGDGPYKRMLQGLASYEEGKKVVPLQGDGLNALKGHEVEEIVIAGMGGELIAAILSRHSPRPGQQLLLQPMTREGALRRALHAGGWCISREAHIREDKRIYTLIEAFAGKEEPPYRPAEEEVGRFCREGAGREKLLRRLAEEKRVAESRRAAGREDRMLEEWIREWEAMV